YPLPVKIWTPQLLIFGEAMQLVIALGVTWLMARIEGRSLAVYGLPLRRMVGARFWEGALWGVGSAAVVYGVVGGGRRYTGHGFAVRGGDALLMPLLWALAFLAVAVNEEVDFRGFQLFTVSRGMGFWPGALLLSLVFGGLHYFQKPHESWLDFLNVGLVG